MIGNHVSIIGNLGSDPTLRQSKSGTSVCNLSIAVDRRFNKRNGDGTTTAIKDKDWMPVVAWDKLAETVAVWLKQGSQIAVVGSLRMREWQDTNGNNHRTAEIRAEDIKFLKNIRTKEEVADRKTATATTPTT